MGVEFLDKSDMEDVLEAIRMFEEDVEIEISRPVNINEDGKIQKSGTKKIIKMAIMTPKAQTGNTVGNFTGTAFNFQKEGYLDLTRFKKLHINEKIKIKNEEFKVVNTEENYGIFQRMELTKDGQSK